MENLSAGCVAAVIWAPGSFPFSLSRIDLLRSLFV